MSTPKEWSRAFAIQASSDFSVRAFLLNVAELPECHQLHYLQMACEKVCKAHLYSKGKMSPVFQTSHAYIAKVLPEIATQNLLPTRKYQWALSQIKHLARQIELLAPAVDDGGRRSDNCEYPWEDHQGRVQVPAERAFPNLSLLNAPAGKMVLEILVVVSSQLAQQGLGKATI